MKNLDKLCYNDRVKEAARNGDFDALWPEHPHLALVAARHAGQTQRLLDALLDPRVSVTKPAVALLRTVSPMPDFREILPKCCAAVGVGLVSVAATRATPEQALQLLPVVEACYGAQEARHLLRALSPEEVERHLPRLAARVSNWRGLAKRHPDAVLKHLRETLQETPDRDRAKTWQRFRPALTVLAQRRPEPLLELARELHPPESLPPLPFAFLARTHPDSVQELFLRGQFPPPPHLRRLGRERLTKLTQHYAHDPRRVAAVLGSCAPAWRAELFEATYGQTDRVWPLELLAVLPRELRHREAERMLAQRASQVSPDVALEVAIYATPESAERLFEPESKAALAEERARGVSGWIKNCACNRGDLAALLQRLVPRLKNEQDPVRLAACRALMEAPPTVFTAETLKPLGDLVSAVTQARDTSWATRTCLQQLGMRLLRRGALDPNGPLLPFSLDLQRKLVQQSGRLAWPCLSDLPHGTEQKLFEALQRWVKASNERDAYAPVLSLGMALGKRAREVEGLQKLIAEATRAKPDWVAMQAIHLWLDPPATRGERVRKLLDKDESFIVVGSVFAHVHHRRQDWLDPYLTPRVLSGRFANKKTRYLLPAERGFHRWLPRQQAEFGKALVEVARDTGRSDFERAATIRRLSRLPAMNLGNLKDFLRNTSVPILEAALAAATHLDQPAEALPILLEHLDGDQARVAMYAVPRVARYTLPGVLGSTLRDLLAREKLKVTVHKEVLRLLGAHRVPGAGEILAEQWARPELHRDIRIAVLHAARALQEWGLLEQAAEHPNPAVARALLDEHPEWLPREDRQRYAGLVRKVALHSEPRVREAAYKVLPAWAAGLEEDTARVLSQALLDLTLGPEWKAAAASFVQVIRDGQAGDILTETASQLAGAPREPDAEAERDLPAQQRWLFLESLLFGLEWRKRKALDLGRLPGLALQVAALRWPSLEGFENLTRTKIPDLVLQAFERELQDPHFEWEGVEQACDRLAAGDVTARRMAVRLVDACGNRFAWEAPWRERLRRLRADSDPVVRWEASRRFTVLE